MSYLQKVGAGGGGNLTTFKLSFTYDPVAFMIQAAHMSLREDSWQKSQHSIVYCLGRLHGYRPGYRPVFCCLQVSIFQKAWLPFTAVISRIFRVLKKKF